MLCYGGKTLGINNKRKNMKFLKYFFKINVLQIMFCYSLSDITNKISLLNQYKMFYRIRIKQTVISDLCVRSLRSNGNTYICENCSHVMFNSNLPEHPI